MIPHLTDEQMKLNIRGLTADRLRTFYYVAKLESTTLAGDKLGLCQSAVSKQIQLIEDELGFLLFHRHGRKLTLTTLGIRIFELAEKVLFEIDGTLKSIKEEYEGDNGGILRIMTFPSFASVMIPRYLKGFNLEHPQIKLDIKASYGEMFVTETDVIIRDPVPDNDHLAQLPLYRQVTQIYASRTYLKQYGTPTTLEDLSKHNLLALDKHLEAQYLEINWLLNLGFVRNSYAREAAMRVPSNDALINSVANGFGIAGLAKHHVAIYNNPDIVQILPEHSLIRPPTCFIFNKKALHTAKYEKIYHYLKAQIDKEMQFFANAESLIS